MLKRASDATRGSGRDRITAGNRMGIAVQGRRHPAVIQSPGHEGQGHPAMQHLGGHEVAEVVQPERSQAGTAPSPKEGLGDPVGLPGASAVRVVAGHEPAAEMRV